MPEQKFRDPVTGDDVMVISWDMGMRAVDIAFGGTLLTRITQVEALRSTGIQGTAPDGSHLLVHLVRGGNGDVFTVDRAGVSLEAQHVNFAAPGPPVGDMVMAGVRSTTPRTDGLGLDAHGRLMVNGARVDDRALSGVPDTRGGQPAIDKGRTWLLVMAILDTLFAGLMLAVLMLARVVETHVDDTLRTAGRGDLASQPHLAKAMSTAMLILTVYVGILAATAVLWWVLWVVSKGAKAPTAFAVARIVTGAYLLMTVVQLVQSISSGTVVRGVGGTVFGLAINWFAFSAFQGGREASVARREHLAAAAA